MVVPASQVSFLSSSQLQCACEVCIFFRHTIYVNPKLLYVACSFLPGYCSYAIEEMNWTGGRLKRHSQANGNRIAKSQKHFAKAPLKRQNGPGALRALSAPKLSFSGTSAPVQRPKCITASRQPPSEPYATPGEYSRSNIQAPGCAELLTHTSQDGGAISGHSGRGVQEHIHHSDKPETLSSIKRKLLQNPDWAGLSILRPVAYSFTAAEEMEAIGRHRKVTKEELRKNRQSHLDHQAAHYDIIRPFRNRQSLSVTQPEEPTDLSIRMGSNIHQTITTQPSNLNNANSPAGHSTTTDSMLLDAFETVSNVRSPKSVAMSTAPAPGTYLNLSRAPDTNLLPLNEALDFKNFDEVRARSSLVQPRRRSLTSFQNPASDLASVGNPYSTPSKVALIELRSHRVHETTMKPVPQPPHSREDKLRRPSAPKFTLDHQVALGWEANSNRQRSDHSSSVLSKRTCRSHPNLEHSKHLQPHTDESLGSCPASDESKQSCRTRLGMFFSIPRRGHKTMGAHVDGTPMPQSINRSPISSGPDSRQPSYSHINSLSSSSGQNCVSNSQFANQEPQRLVGRAMDISPHRRTYSSRIGDENETWMKYVFPQDFDRLRNDFTFGHAPLSSNRDTATTKNSILDERTLPFSLLNGARQDDGLCANYTSSVLSGLSDPSAANATLFGAGRDQEGLSSQSETDFLSRFSPMEGVLDERLGDMSMYNNAAVTNRSFVSLPQTMSGMEQLSWQTPMRQSIPAKRKALYNLEDLVQATPLDNVQGIQRAALENLARVPWASSTPVEGNFIAQQSRQNSDREDFQKTVCPTQPMADRRAKRGAAAFPFNYSPASGRSKAHRQPVTSSPYFPGVPTSRLSVVGVIDAARGGTYEQSPATNGHGSWHGSSMPPSDSSSRPTNFGVCKQYPLFGNSSSEPGSEHN